MCSEFIAVLSKYQNMHKSGVLLSAENISSNCQLKSSQFPCIEFLELKDINISEALHCDRPLVAMPVDVSKYQYQTSLSEFLEKNKNNNLTEKDISDFIRKYVLNTQIELRKRICLQGVGDDRDRPKGSDDLQRLVQQSLGYLEKEKRRKETSMHHSDGSEIEEDIVIDSTRDLVQEKEGHSLHVEAKGEQEASTSPALEQDGMGRLNSSDSGINESISVFDALVALRNFLVDEYWFKRHGWYI